MAQVGIFEGKTAEDSQAFFEANIRMAVYARIQVGHSKAVGQPVICLQTGSARNFLKQQDIRIVLFHQAGKPFKPVRTSHPYRSQQVTGALFGLIQTHFGQVVDSEGGFRRHRPPTT